MYSFFKKYRRKIQTKTEKMFLYFLSSIFCFNMTDCIPCFLLYKEFESEPLFERDLLQNHSNSRLFGYSILSRLVISSCRMHEPKLWFRILLCRDKSCDFVAVSARRNLWFRYSTVTENVRKKWSGTCDFATFVRTAFWLIILILSNLILCPHRSCKQEERRNNWTDEEGGRGEKLNRRVG